MRSASWMVLSLWAMTSTVCCFMSRSSAACNHARHVLEVDSCVQLRGSRPVSQISQPCRVGMRPWQKCDCVRAVAALALLPAWAAAQTTASCVTC